MLQSYLASKPQIYDGKRLVERLINNGCKINEREGIFNEDGRLWKRQAKAGMS